MPLLNVLLIALVAPAGLAVCAAGAAVVVLRRRRKQKGQQASKDGLKQGVASKQEGPVTRPAMLLRRSLNCSETGGRSSVSGDGTCVQQLQPGETGFGSMPGSISRLGGGLSRYPSIEFSAGMVTLPPARDSMDLSSQLQRATRGSIDWSVVEPSHAHAHAPHAPHAKWSMAGSIAGMASSVAHALHFR
jgi:hypothetical protein